MQSTILHCVLSWWSPSLQSIISGRNGLIPCVGETIMYICTVASAVHTWEIPSLYIYNSTCPHLSPSWRTCLTVSQFSIAVIADDEFVTTALSTTAVAEFYFTNITCADGTVRPGGEEEVQKIRLKYLVSWLTCARWDAWQGFNTLLDRKMFD